MAATAALLIAAGVIANMKGRDITVHGSMTLTQGQFFRDRNCEGDDGYNDIKQGTQITVTTTDGTILAFANLSAGRAPTAYECDFTFMLTVPAGKGIYIFAIVDPPPAPQRGSRKFSEADLRAGPVQLEIGALDGGLLVPAVTG